MCIRDRHWKTPSSPRAKKARMSYSKFKAMLIVFFDIQGIVIADWVPSGQTVNQQYYKQVLEKLRERVRKKCPELWKNGWILHPVSYTHLDVYKRQALRCKTREIKLRRN